LSNYFDLLFWFFTSPFDDQRFGNVAVEEHKLLCTCYSDVVDKDIIYTDSDSGFVNAISSKR